MALLNNNNNKNNGSREYIHSDPSSFRKSSVCHLIYDAKSKIVDQSFFCGIANT